MDINLIHDAIIDWNKPFDSDVVEVIDFKWFGEWMFKNINQNVVITKHLYYFL